jgi:hypothetical protein
VSMNVERFRNSPSGRLLKAGQGDAAYRAFVPNALPPSLTLDADWCVYYPGQTAP